MINVQKTRALYENFVGGKDRRQPRGRKAFVDTIRYGLGLCDKHGNNFKDRAGNRVVNLAEAKTSAEEYSLQELAEAIIGPTWRTYFDPGNRNSMSDANRFTATVGQQFPGDQRAVLEAPGVGVDVSAFVDINAWTGVTGGLIERKILEQFQSPNFIADQVMPAEPTRIAEGQKVIGAARIGDLGEERQPGQAHKRGLFGERYVTLGKTRENALACDVTKEAAFFDLTGQVLQTAGSIGEWLGYRKEVEVLSSLAGVTGYTGTNTDKWAFTYTTSGGTATKYALYATAAASPIPLNSLSNELLDWTSLQAAWLPFVRMNDPETGTRILVNPDTMIVNPAKLATAEMILGARETETRTGYVNPSTVSTQSAANTLQIRRTAGAPFKDLAKKLLWSPILENICTAAASGTPNLGLGLSQANANIYWWLLDSSKFAKYMQNWPLQIVTIPGTSYDQQDRGLIYTAFAHERGMPSIWSIWHIVQNTN